MKHLAVIVILVFCWSSGSAQCIRDEVRISRLQGRVAYPGDGGPIAGASVSVRKPDQSENKPVAETDTDSAGNFELPRLKPGKYILSISYPNLDPIITRLTIKSRQQQGDFLQVELAPTDFSGTDSCEGNTKVINQKN